MGFNLSGVAINKNYEDSFNALQNQLGWHLEKQGEIDFETASSNWKEENICDVYFCETGTLLFLSMDRCAEAYLLKDDHSLTFVLSELSMVFNLNYSEGAVEIRSITEVEGERLQDKGEHLAVEDTSEDTSEIIWNQIEVVIGKRFWNIEPDERAFRYVFTKPESVEPAPTPITLNAPDIYREDARSVEQLSLKKWWQFWK